MFTHGPAGELLLLWRFALGAGTVKPSPPASALLLHCDGCRRIFLDPSAQPRIQLNHIRPLKHTYY